MYADALNLWKKLDQKIELYELNNGSKLTSSEIASLLSRTLYEKRFFPFYTFNILIGNVNGEGVVWSYDAIGSYGISKFECSGDGKNMM